MFSKIVQVQNTLHERQRAFCTKWNMSCKKTRIKYVLVAGIHAVSVLFTVWIFVSFIDVNCYNLKEGTEAAWNFFNLLLCFI